MRRTVLILLVIVFSMTHLLLGTAMSKETVLNVGIGSDTVGFDPHNISTNQSVSMNCIIYDFLVTFDEKLNIKPGLAAEWTTSKDGTVWTFQLRKGIKFHSGAEFDANAVKRNFDRILAGGTLRTSFFEPFLKEVKVVDKYTVQFVTKFPYGPLLSNLAHSAGMIADMSVVDKGENLKSKPSGTGAYMLQEWVPGDYAAYVANRDYWKGKPKIDKLVLKIIPDDTTRTMMLKTGELDVAERISPFELEKLSKDENVKINIVPSTNFTYLGLNTQGEILKDVRVRQALNYAVDREMICTKILKGMAQPANTCLAPLTWGYARNVKGYSYNPKKAKELLAQAGWKDTDGDGILEKGGKKLSLTFWTTSGVYLMDVKVSEALQGYFKDVGFDVKLVTMDHAARVSMLRKPVEEAKHEMFINQHAPSTADADWGLRPEYLSDMWPPKARNMFFYANKEVDQYVTEGMKSVDPAKRMDVYAKAQEIIVREAPTVLLYYTKLVYGNRRNVRGLVLLPVEHMQYWNASKE